MITQQLKLKAIQSLVPGAQVVVYENEIKWIEPEESPITEEELLEEVTKLQIEYDANQHQRDRVYPSIGDQLDMLWHAIDAGTLNKTSDFYKTIKAVKDAYPKSE